MEQSQSRSVTFRLMAGQARREAAFFEAAAAAAAVFDIVELFEMILLELPIKEIILLPRVCKQWCTAIKRSPSLQQALFFSALPGGTADLIHHPRGSFFSQNEKLFPYSEIPKGHFAISPTDYNFLNQDQRPEDEAAYMRAVRVHRNPFEDSIFRRSVKQHSSFWYPEASWRRMLICQPAMHSVNVTLIRGHQSLRHSTYLCSNDDTGGLRMGQWLAYSNDSRFARASDATEWLGWQTVKLGREVRLSEHVVRYLPFQEETPYLIKDDSSSEEEN